MKYFNPLYILIFIVFINIFVYIDTNNTKQQITQTSQEISKLKIKAMQINTLQNIYSNPKKRKMDFLRILSRLNMKNNIKEKAIKNKKAFLKLEADAFLAKRFIEKLMNENFKLQSLKIKSLNNQALLIEAEVIF